MNYGTVTPEDMQALRPEWTFNFVPTSQDLNLLITDEIITLIQQRAEEDRPAVIITPVGPLDYTVLADACNAAGVSCRNLVAFCMDEYCDEDGDAVPLTHPLSFRRYVRDSLFLRLSPELRPPEEQIIFPDPKHPEKVQEQINHFGGVDIMYGGMGINGHLAFNEPPERDAPGSAEDVRNSDTRVVTISREGMTQMAMGGTAGDWDIIPCTAVTVGMRQLLSARRLHLTFMRTWHAGVLRRALFGPVTPRVPGSFVQEHPNVTVTMTESASRVPLLNVTQKK
jgi:glucosamine-6-phosphate deaminase